MAIKLLNTDVKEMVGLRVILNNEFSYWPKFWFELYTKYLTVNLFVFWSNLKIEESILNFLTNS